jgi:hypothetical protein
MVANRKGRNSLWGTTGCEAYEVRPHENGDGFDQSTMGFDMARSGMQGQTRSVTRSRTRSTVLSRARTKQRSACWTTSAL